MTYAIAKRAMYTEGAHYYVTKIKQGGMRIDNMAYHGSAFPWSARQFKTREQADKALHQLATVGGFDDYVVVELA
jgi:hypothetical protein